MTFRRMVAWGILWMMAAVAVGAEGNTNSEEPRWTQWRGEKRDGASNESGLLGQWPEGGPRLLWKAEDLGRGFSSLSIAKGRIFTMGDQDGGMFVIALDLNGGKELWRTRIGNEWEPGGYAGPRCTPTIDGDRLYVIGPHGDLVCLAVKDGHELWHKSMQQDFGGRMSSGWGYSESPLVDGDKLVCTPGGPDAAIVALNKLTGKEIWRSKLPPIESAGGEGAAYSSIVIGNGGGIRQYVQLMGQGLVGIDAETGKYLWSYGRIANRTANIPTPLINGDYIFCSSGYQTGAALLKLVPEADGIKVEEQYFLDAKDFQNHHGGMIMLGDYVYAGHGHNKGAPTCLNWKTGETVWRHNRGPGTGSSAVTYADGNLYFRFQDGVLALVGATPEAYQEKSHFEIPEVEQPSWSHPVIVGGKLYLREQDALYCYDVKQ